MIVADATRASTYALIPPVSIDAVVTSPPYAMQRKKQYGGVPEEVYPVWTVKWMRHIARVLKPSGSVAMVIRSHVRDGAISDYVLRTRLALHKDGWREPEELIWFKPDAPPLGHTQRPRRSWEHILWFARPDADGVVRCHCDPKANGIWSDEIGWGPGGHADEVYGTSPAVQYSGMARAPDVVRVRIAENARNTKHPAAYPPPLAEWIIKLIVPEGGTVLDPFFGSGTTGVAAEMTGRRFVGIERHVGYVAYAETRLKDKEVRNFA